MESDRPESTPAEGPVDRAFNVLQVIVAAGEAVGVREIGRRTGLPRSTASRLVASLERLRMVERTADGGVVPGSGLATLQTGASATPLLREQLRPLLVELVQAFGENAALAIDDGDAMFYVSQVASENPVSVHDVVGERHDFHLVAPGIVTMTFWDDRRRASYLSDDLLAATEFSVIEPDRILRRLDLAKTDGFAWTNEELDVGVNGLAVPVLGNEGALVATISLYGPSYRFSPKAQPALGEELRRLVRNRTQA